LAQSDLISTILFRAFISTIKGSLAPVFYGNCET